MSAAPRPDPIPNCSVAGTTLTNNAIAVVWSLAQQCRHHRGHQRDGGQNAAPLASAGATFVVANKSNIVATEFDDIVTWISTPMLFNRLVAAGQLP